MPTDGDPSLRSHVDAAGRADRDVDARTSARPGDGTLPRSEVRKDERVRRWDVVTPSATRIGRADRPDADLDESVRRLHDERHPAMQGHSDRMHRLDKARIAHALCNALDLTPWERDRVLGIVREVDFTAFGSQRAIPKVALVVIRHVVDRERRARLGLDDREWLSDQSAETFEELSERYTSITDEQAYRDLLAEHGLDVTSVNRLDRVLSDELDDGDLRGAALGHAPHRDPHLPPLASRTG